MGALIVLVLMAAANLLDHVAAQPQVDSTTRAHAAYGAVRARRALSAHDRRDSRLIASLDTFLALVPAERSDRVTVARFLRASLHRRHDRDEAAIPDLAYVVEHARTHEVGPYAVNLLLDAYLQTGRDDELVALARRLREDVALAVRDEELPARLLQIDVAGTRQEAEALEAQARASGDRAAYVACGERYDRARILAVDRARDDELLHDAALCFERGGAFTTALARQLELVRRFPRSPLADRAWTHLWRLVIRRA